MLKKIIFILLFVFCINLGANSVTIIYTGKMRDIQHSNYSNLYTLLSEYRQKGDVIFAFGGNSLGPSMVSNLDNGAHIIGLLNTLNPDFYGVLNSDFSYSADELCLRADEANFPFISSNITDIDGKELYLVKPNILIEKGGIKIGFINVFDHISLNKYNFSDIASKNLKQSIIDNSKILKDKGADLIVLLTSGYTKVPDLFFKNHIVDLELSKFVRAKDIQRGEKSFNINTNNGVLVIKVDKNDSNVSFNVSKKSLSDYKRDPKIALSISSYTSKLNTLFRTNIIETNVDLNTEKAKVRSEENIFANILADSMRMFADADIALVNGGSIRGNKFYPKGTIITRKDLLNEFPFSNKLALLEVSGDVIYKAFEHSLDIKKETNGKFLHISGGKVVYDSKNKKIIKFYIGDKPLDKNQIYKLATTDFLYFGGDNFKMLKAGKRIKNFKIDNSQIVNILIDYLLELDSIDPKLDRLIDVSKPKKDNI